VALEHHHPLPDLRSHMQAVAAAAQHPAQRVRAVQAVVVGVLLQRRRERLHRLQIREAAAAAAAIPQPSTVMLALMEPSFCLCQPFIILPSQRVRPLSLQAVATPSSSSP
jgi:hypothetical protein